MPAWQLHRPSQATDCRVLPRQAPYLVPSTQTVTATRVRDHALSTRANEEAVTSKASSSSHSSILQTDPRTSSAVNLALEIPSFRTRHLQQLVIANGYDPRFNITALCHIIFISKDYVFFGKTFKCFIGWKFKTS